MWCCCACERACEHIHRQRAEIDILCIMRRPVRAVCFVLLLVSLAGVESFAAKKAAGKGKSNKAKSSKKSTASGGGFGGGRGGGFGSTAARLPTLGDSALDAAVAVRCEAIQKSKLSDGKAWLELGSLLVKAKEYAEAERIFRAGAAHAPENEMLAAAALTLGGDSAAYCRSAWGASANPLATDDANFEAYEAPREEIAAVDQADRAVDFDVMERARRGAVHRSKSPLLDPADCAWVIEQVEAQAAITGWTQDRHVQAPTTDIPVSQVPAIREWFDKQLETNLFPMLAARFPTEVASASQLRVMDAFVVRYDAREQASLPTHQDENTLSFTIALNDRSEYEGGGTLFPKLRQVASSDPFAETVLNADAGGVVAFPGKLRHGGNVVTKGRRYIIPLFIYVDANKSGRDAGYVLKHLGVPEAAQNDDAALSRYAQNVGDAA